MRVVCCLESNINAINANLLNTAGSLTYVRENESVRYYGSVIDPAISNFNLTNKLLKYETHEISPVYDKELKDRKRKDFYASGFLIRKGKVERASCSY